MVLFGNGLLGGGGDGICSIWKLDMKGLLARRLVACGCDDAKLLGLSGNEGMVLLIEDNELGVINDWLLGPIGSIPMVN